MEPALGKQAHAWDKEKRIRMAVMFERWSRQLRFSVAGLPNDPFDKLLPYKSPEEATRITTHCMWTQIELSLRNAEDEGCTDLPITILRN